MSMTLMVKALKTKVGNPLRKLVLLKLADNANDQGECWPSYQYIADQCEMSKRSVMIHITKLIEDGFLRKEHRIGGEKKNKSNLYTLMVGAGDSLGVVQEIHHPSAGDSLGGGAGDSPRTYHSLEPPIKPLDQSKIARAQLEEDSFEYWWKEYPKKVAKQSAFKSWKKVIKKMSDETVTELTNHIVNDVKLRLDDLASGSDKFIGFDRLHPTTYLNQERYNDDI